MKRIFALATSTRSLAIWGMLALSAQAVTAQRPHDVTCGEAITTSSSPVWKEALGVEFFPGEAVILDLETKVFVLHQQSRPSWKAYLSVFEQGQQDDVWEVDNIIFYENAPGTREPTLVGCDLNTNGRFEIFLTYFDGTGVGSAGHSGTTRLLLMLDERLIENAVFDVSFYELVRCKPGDDTCADAGEAYEEVSLLLYTETQTEPWTLYLWSHSVARFRNQTNREQYTVRTVQIADGQAREIHLFEGDFQRTSEFLHTILQSEKRQPFFLQVDSDGVVFLDADDWF